MPNIECSGCGLRSCDGRCFDECEADYAEPEADDTGITLDALRARHQLLDLTVQSLGGGRSRVCA